MNHAARRNIRLLIAYDGTVFCGWQRQKNELSIQGLLEEKLGIITKETVEVNGAGRTDAGVHAEGMTTNFRTGATMPPHAFLKALNSLLPKDIRILDASDAPPDFHARFDAAGKTYRYDFFTGSIQNPSERLFRTHVPKPFVLDRVLPCLKHLIGSHDFSSFEAVGSRDRSKISGRGAVRTLFRTECTNHADHPEYFSFYFTGDGFLRHMVRNLVGTLFLVGCNRITSEEFLAIFASRDRKLSGPTAPAHGLFLEQVHYQPPIEKNNK